MSKNNEAARPDVAGPFQDGRRVSSRKVADVEDLKRSRVEKRSIIAARRRADRPANGLY